MKKLVDMFFLLLIVAISIYMMTNSTNLGVAELTNYSSSLDNQPKVPLSAQQKKSMQKIDDTDYVNPVGINNFMIFEKVKTAAKRPAFSVKDSNNQFRVKNPYTIPTKEKLVSLTFDDGPDNQITPRILDHLKQFNAKATFYFVGMYIPIYTNVVKRTHEEGHLVMNHSWSHPQFSKMGDEAVKLEIEKTNEVIERITGKNPRLVRVPFGDVNLRINNILKELNLESTLWTLDSIDWALMDRNKIADAVIKNVQPGDIILFHSSSSLIETAEAIPIILSTLSNQGYRFVSVSELLGINPYNEM